MNKYQKETVKMSLEDEKKVLNSLTSEYKEAKKAVKGKLKALMERDDADLPHVIHQIKYQKALESQLDEVLDKLKNGTYKSISDYMEDSYGTGFTSSLYRLQKQGVPLLFPMDRNEILKAVQTNSKISGGLYKRLGINTRSMKNAIRQEITRGISSSMSYGDIARNLDNRMNSGLYNSYRIARTEGHRINQEASYDAMEKAKDAGADIVKQWDSTLDGRTRPHHSQLNGQIRELDEPFEVAGLQAMHPSGFGKASEDINCRCVVLEIGRWELDEDETHTKFDGNDGVIVSDLSDAENYEEFRRKYNIEVKKKEPEDKEWSPPIEKSEIRKNLEQWKIGYKQVEKFNSIPSNEDIIRRLCGGDRTTGSCSSLAFAYMGNRSGLDVLDFRGGQSTTFFSWNMNIEKIANLPNAKSSITKALNEIKGGMEVLKNIEQNKEYYFAIGRHASIVRKTTDGLEYLELQSAYKNGWKPLDATVLRQRFGCTRSRTRLGIKVESKIFLIEVDSFKEDDEFRAILGYINTPEGSQMKGMGGGIK